MPMNLPPLAPCRTLHGTAAVFFFLIAGAPSARAQQEALLLPPPSPFALKAGLFLPLERNGRNTPGNAQFLIEAECTLRRGLLEKAFFNTIRISIGYTEKNELSILPVTVSQVRENERSRSGVAVYYGYGLGLYRTKVDAPNTSRKTKNLFGGFVVAGADLGPRLFLEAKYHLLSHYDNENVSGLQLAAGARF